MSTPTIQSEKYNTMSEAIDDAKVIFMRKQRRVMAPPRPVPSDFEIRRAVWLATLDLLPALEIIKELRQKEAVPTNFRPRIYKGSNDLLAQEWLNDAAATLGITFYHEDDLRRYLAWEAITRLAQPGSDAKQLSFAIWYCAEIHLPEPEALALIPMSMPSDWPAERKEAEQLSVNLRIAASNWLSANPIAPPKPPELDYLGVHLWDVTVHGNLDLAAPHKSNSQLLERLLGKLPKLVAWMR